ncbi:MAG: pimeloyl-ACP methyl ester carboxylesterase [Bradymonadia bacterium]|jgi:pimeloyl-ACP methyl ester carboxylesterase
MGGRLALRLAHLAPNLVEGLTLISASPGLEDEAGRASRRALDDRRAEEILSDFAQFRLRWYAAPLFALEAEQVARAAARRAAVDPASAAEMIRALSPGREPASWSVLDSLVGPVLLVAGERDAKYAALTQRIYERLGGRGSLALIPGVGHSTHVDAPTQLGRLIDVWLSA